MIAGEAKDDFKDIDETFRPVAKEFGRGIFALVMNAGIAGEAAARLAQEVRTPEARHALHTLARIFNETSSALVKEAGWGEERVAQCESAIKAAWAGRLTVVERSGLIVPS